MRELEKQMQLNECRAMAILIISRTCKIDKSVVFLKYDKQKFQFLVGKIWEERFGKAA
jgi:hypothetical protein